MKKALLLIAIIPYLYSTAQTVVRGPYMQSPLPDGIVVMWRTDVTTDSEVWYGTNPSNLNQTATGNTSATDHSVTITGLQPNTKYYYAVGTGGNILGGNTNNHYFVTNPPVGSQDSIRIWAIGDFGKGNTEQVDVKQSYLNYTGNIHTDVWLWLGDNAYDNGEDSEYQQKVFGLTGFSDIFSWLPFWPTPGNHDYGTVWSESTLLGIPYSNIALEDHQGPYFDIVDVPENAEAGGYPSNLEVFYSFDYGNVHFMSLNSEVYDYLQTKTGINRMIDWIQQDLAQNTQTFTIAYFHQPPFSKGSHDSDDIYEEVMKEMRESIAPVLEQFNVDLVVCGHSHVYERSFLVKDHTGNSSTWDPATMLVDGSNGNYAQGNQYVKNQFATSKEGTVYVVCGNGGSKKDDASLDHPVFYFADGGSTAVGSFVMDVYRNRLDGKYLRADGQVLDDFTLFKKNLVLEQPLADTICEGETIQLAANYTGGSDNLSFNWSVINETTSQVMVEPIGTTTYTLTVEDIETGQVETVDYIVNVEQCATGVEEYDQLNVLLFPNPTKSSFTLKMNEGVKTISIWNVEGKKLQEFQSFNKTEVISMDEYPVGNYICKIKMKDGSKTIPFIKE